MSLQEPDDGTLARLCGLYCSTGHVDLCDTRHIPGLGDLNTQHPVGRLWRFQVTERSFRLDLTASSPQPLGDPTVRRFESRDVDAWILPRERAAVSQWEQSPGWVHGVSDDSVTTRASKRTIRRFVITEKAPTRAFSWLKADYRFHI